MAKIKYFGRTGKSKEMKILVRIYYGRLFDASAPTGKLIDPDKWNNKSGQIKQRSVFPGRDELETDLKNLRDHLIKELNNISDKSEITGSWLKSAIDKYYNPNRYNQDKTLFGHIQKFIDSSNNRTNTHGDTVCYKVRREYEVTFGYLKEYAAKYGTPDFRDIDNDFREQFIDMLREKGLKTNTIGKKLQTLKTFLNDAHYKGINQYLKYKDRNFRTPKEETDNIYLTKDEIMQFYVFNLSDKPYLERVRDLFVAACWTGGIRFSDWQKITSDRIKNNILILVQQKTKMKVFIPVHPILLEILDKYDNSLPDIISNQKFNEFLKKAAKLAGINDTFRKPFTDNKTGLTYDKIYHKHELISSHTARRSFATNNYLDGVPVPTIRSITGHKTDTAFYKYIKVDGQKHAELLADLWQKKYFKEAK